MSVTPNTNISKHTSLGPSHRQGSDSTSSNPFECGHYGKHLIFLIQIWCRKANYSVSRKTLKTQFAVSWWCKMSSTYMKLEASKRSCITNRLLEDMVILHFSRPNLRSSTTRWKGNPGQRPNFNQQSNAPRTGDTNICHRFLGRYLSTAEWELLWRIANTMCVLMYEWHQSSFNTGTLKTENTSLHTQIGWKTANFQKVQHNCNFCWTFIIVIKLKHRGTKNLNCFTLSF